MEPGPAVGYSSESEDESVNSRCILCAAYVPDDLLRQHLVKLHGVTTSHKFILDICTICAATEEQKKMLFETIKNQKDLVTPRKPTKPTPAVRRSRSESSDIQDQSAKRRKVVSRDNAGDKNLVVPVSSRKGRPKIQEFLKPTKKVSSMRCSPCNLVFPNISRLKQHAKKHPRAYSPCEKCKTPLNTFNEMLSHVKSCKLSPLRSSSPNKDYDLHDKTVPRDQLVVGEDEGEGNIEVQPDNPAAEMSENIQENEDAEKENVNPREDDDKAAEDDPDVSGFVCDEEGKVDSAERRSENTEGDESSDDESSGRRSRSDVQQNEDNKSQEEAENLNDDDDHLSPEEDANPPDVDEEKSVLQEWFDNVPFPWEDSTKSERNDWACQICDQRYTRKGNLVRHQRRDHGYSSSPIRQRSKTILPQIAQPTASRPRSKTVLPKAQDISVDRRRSRSKSSLPASVEKDESTVRGHKLDKIPNPTYFARRTNMFGFFKEEQRALYDMVDPNLPEGWKISFNPVSKKYKFLPPDEVYFLKSKIGVYKYMLGLPGQYSEEELERVHSSLSVAMRKELESEQC